MTVDPPSPKDEKVSEAEQYLECAKSLMMESGWWRNEAGYLTDAARWIADAIAALTPTAGGEPVAVTVEMVNAAWNRSKDLRMTGLPTQIREVLEAAMKVAPRAHPAPGAGVGVEAAMQTVIEAARDLVMKPGGLRMTPAGTFIVEKADRSDPHYRLCAAFDKLDALLAASLGDGNKELGKAQDHAPTACVKCGCDLVTGPWGFTDCPACNPNPARE